MIKVHLTLCINRIKQAKESHLTGPLILIRSPEGIQIPMCIFLLLQIPPKQALEPDLTQLYLTILFDVPVKCFLLFDADILYELGEHQCCQPTTRETENEYLITHIVIPG